VGEAAAGVVPETLELLGRHRVPSTLAVLKRFGPSDPGPLSFPMAGWTLALDFPAGHPRLGPLLASLDEMVVEAGGRVYLAKDSRLPSALLKVMYPRHEELAAAREAIDPDSVLRSDLSRRLGLEGDGATG
jgi:decaprenylphospho-beta-D-ribofuranose 2-oxidase